MWSRPGWLKWFLNDDKHTQIDSPSGFYYRKVLQIVATGTRTDRKSLKVGFEASVVGLGQVASGPECWTPHRFEIVRENSFKPSFLKRVYVFVRIFLCCGWFLPPPHYRCSAVATHLNKSREATLSGNDPSPRRKHGENIHLSSPEGVKKGEKKKKKEEKAMRVLKP